MAIEPGVHWLWPTPIGVHRYPEAAGLNAKLVEGFAEGRAAREKARGIEQPQSFFASDDDLLHRVKLDEWQDFVGWLVSSLGENARPANPQAGGGQGPALQGRLQGVWVYG